ncbi:hypothetical protein, partial [Salmonella sp. ZJHZ19_0081]
ADRNRSHWSTSKTPSYTKSVSWQHHHDDLRNGALMADIGGSLIGLCAVKGYISSVGGSMSEAFWYYTGCM